MAGRVTSSLKCLVQFQQKIVARNIRGPLETLAPQKRTIPIKFFDQYPMIKIVDLIESFELPLKAGPLKHIKDLERDTFFLLHRAYCGLSAHGMRSPIVRINASTLVGPHSCVSVTLAAADKAIDGAFVDQCKTWTEVALQRAASVLKVDSNVGEKAISRSGVLQATAPGQSPTIVPRDNVPSDNVSAGNEKDGAVNFFHVHCTNQCGNCNFLYSNVTFMHPVTAELAHSPSDYCRRPRC